MHGEFWDQHNSEHLEFRGNGQEHTGTTALHQNRQARQASARIVRRVSMPEVFLGVGHGVKPDGTFDPGAQAPGRNEYELNWKVVAATAGALDRSGVSFFNEEAAGKGHDPNFVGSARKANDLQGLGLIVFGVFAGAHGRPRNASARAGSRLMWRNPAAIRVCPACRSSPMARLRKAAMTCGPALVRMRLASSAKV